MCSFPDHRHLSLQIQSAPDPKLRQVENIEYRLRIPLHPGGLHQKDKQLLKPPEDVHRQQL